MMKTPFVLVANKYVLMLLLGLLISASIAFADDDGAGASSSPKKYYVQDIKKAMMDYIEQSIDENGVFQLEDEKTGETLSLKFVEIHDPVRVINSNTYFACTDFHVEGNPKKLYDLDFWMSPVDGVLKIYKTKIHKEPRKSLIYGWYKQPRYTFIDDEIVYLY
jgi:hypothetical protein